MTFYSIMESISHLGKMARTSAKSENPNELRSWDKRQDSYYRNITSTIVWHAASKKTLVEACQINSITNQILYYNK